MSNSMDQGFQAFLEINQNKLIKIVHTYTLLEQEVSELRKEVESLKKVVAILQVVSIH